MSILKCVIRAVNNAFLYCCFMCSITVQFPHIFGERIGSGAGGFDARHRGRGDPSSYRANKNAHI